ncbi:HNH endonuclease [Sphingomonas sp. CFBP 8760]|nr:HNH endonuclease [Sphingomonas sp. CFBP 8760]
MELLCRYCGSHARVEATWVVDHIVALALGGTNDLGNSR